MLRQDNIVSQTANGLLPGLVAAQSGSDHDFPTPSNRIGDFPISKDHTRRASVNIAQEHGAS
jgi:hypothetical protein